VSVGPALVLGILVGVANAALWLVVRGTGGGRLPLIVAAAILGAWAGDTLGDRLGLTIGSIGDFRLVAATIGAWIGIAVVSVVSVLGPSENRS
jgi:uncharacterized membrane protein YeaQ/YmgE (transglycosylase-associated protein family)